ncbi:interferon-induced protein 44-like [Chanos chanos]|uniref:Interferon-induced protein 44-like n=1 Tax=Chanos chanos TaxID=29144 RepID=A0A6J2WQ40_CHACN|nr:interferon-induced protein 44-like [Chanos chanos]
MEALTSDLTSAQERQLCDLLGEVRLHLLYKASVHGYYANSFHERCDNKGPTITVGYNSSGYVFGGYTAKPYAQTGQYINDNTAFLFTFQGGNITRFPVSNSVYSRIDNGNGPTFGQDLYFLYNNSATIHCKPGHYYTFNAATLHGNNLQLTECEVYQVKENTLLSKPWRNIQWEAERRQSLMESIKNYKPLINSVSQIRVLLIGPVGAGKSSFFNSINSIYRGHVTSQAISGHAATSLTTQFRTYTVKSSREGKPLPIVLCDTMGLEESEGAGLDIDDISNILKGCVPDRYKFNPKAPLQTDDKEFCKSGCLEDQIHCVAYVLDSCKISIMSSKLEEKLAAIRKKVNQMGIPQVILLTKVDEACPYVAEDLQNVYLSPYIKNMAKEVSVRVGVPCVLPVKNYSQELELELSSDILLLTAVVQMLRFADNYFDDISPELAKKV